MPPSQIGPYRIVRLLGEGGMGAVYEAIQEPIGRRVALKVLLPQHAQNPDVLARFFNEARAVNLIEHPSIVQVSDYGQAQDGTAYLVMEYLRGQPLSSRLERLHTAGQRIPVAEAVRIAAELADALNAAHVKGIVHRDLKPANVMLVLDPAVPAGERAKVLDFGIAKLAQGQAKGTGTNVVMGTPQYMSPEQCRGAGGVDDKTDVYALGVMLYEMLAGRTPFVAENLIDYLAQHSFQEPPPLQEWAPHAPSELVAFVHSLLIKDKLARPSMSEVSAKLTLWLSRGQAADSKSLSAGLPPTSLSDSKSPGKAPLFQRAPSTLGTLSGQSLHTTVATRRRFWMLATSVGLAATAVFGLGWGISHLSRSMPPHISDSSVQPSSAVPPVYAPASVTSPPITDPELPKEISKPPPSAEPVAVVSGNLNRVAAEPVPSSKLKPTPKQTTSSMRLLRPVAPKTKPARPEKRIPVKRID